MPIHLLWGDDAAARDRAIDALIGKVVDPSWSSLNLSRLDGADAGQALQALEEARTPPFATGERLVLLRAVRSAMAAPVSWLTGLRLPSSSSPTAATWCW